jgi:CDP-diglyceride synthetase
MFAGFFTALFMGHVYIILIITAIQIISFKEVIAIANVPSRARDLSSTKSLNWYWLATTMYFLYGESVIYYFKHIVLVDRVLLPLATHHRFISFVLYVFGRSCARQVALADILSLVLTGGCRVRLLRRFSQSWPSQVPVCSVRMDSHGTVLDRRPGPLHHE